jgi:hypothetical protein
MTTFQVPKKSYVDAYKPSNGARSVGKGELTLNVLDYGVVGDGTADDTTAFQALCTAAVAARRRIYIPGNTNIKITAPIIVNASRFTVLGDGRQSSMITSTHAGAVFTTGDSTAGRVEWSLSKFGLTGPGKTTTGSVGIDFGGILESHIESVRIVGYEKGIRVWSTDGSSGRYNRYYNVEVSNCATGFSIEGNQCNANLFTGCRTNVCDIGLFINNATEVTWSQGEMEGSGTTALHITASSYPTVRTEQNAVIASRFENNNQDWNIEANVLDTLIIPRLIGTPTTASEDAGTRTSVMGVSTKIQSYQSFGSATNSVNGSFQLTRTESSGSNSPLVHVRDSFSGSGAPVTIQASSERAVSGAALFRGLGPSGARVWEVTPQGVMNMLETATTPPNPPANAAALYAKDNGSGKTQLVARFSDGSEVVIAGTGTTTIPVEAFGAVGDGVTSDTSAIQAALNAAGSNGVVTLSPNKTYLCGLLTVKAGTTLQGPGILKASSALANFIMLQSNTLLRDITIEGSGSTNIVRILNADNVRVDKVHITSSAAGSVGVSILNGTHITVERNDVDGVTTGIQATGNNQFIDILNNHVHGHTNRGIYCSATTGTGTKDLNIVGNLVDELGTIGTGVGAMIQVQGGTGTIERVRVHRNKCIGPNRSHTDPTNPGSIDQINCSTINVIAVTNNISVYGGDCGISGAQNKQYIVANNICEFNDTTGIAVGGTAAHSGPGILVIGNVCKNNSQNRVGDRAPNVGAGVALYDAEDVLVADNQCGDDQTTHTQAYGYTTKGSCSNIQFKNNKSDGARLGAYWDDSTGTEIDFQETRATAIPTSGYWPVGAIVRAKNPVASGNIGWVAVAGGGAASGAWQPNTAYNVGDTVTLAGRVLQCLVAGTSGSSYTVTTWGSLGGVPTPGTDGTVVWQYMSLTTASFKSYGAISA